ncbi:unnamed protein product [Phytophthora lilii]|uniref:Unnamed protein product n=1 Tax=Phytophthora lilii TaxID=2077276 RepID=A0A9W6WS03_9STRA|nr:unnamed protein product [Phytophthora lilii]
MFAPAKDSVTVVPPLLVHVEDASHKYVTSASDPQHPEPSTASFDDPVSAISRKAFCSRKKEQHHATSVSAPVSINPFVQTPHTPPLEDPDPSSVPISTVSVVAQEDEDPFAHLTLLKSHKKKRKKAPQSPAGTRSAAKLRSKHRRHAGVLEMAGRTPVTRSMKKKWKRSSLEVVGDEPAGSQEDDVVVQKKLFQSPPKKVKLDVETGASVESKTTGQTRVHRKAVVLKQWRVEWPPVVDDYNRAQLVLTGQVAGEPARFVVGKREGPTKFTSKEGGYVALSGKLDRDAAKSAGIPRAAMDLLEEGIPAYFYKRLLPFVQKPEGLMKQDKKRAKGRPASKKAHKADAFSSPAPSTHDEVDLAPSTPIVSTPIQDDDAFETPKPKKFVPGKTAKDCQAKTFEQFRSPPTNRKPAKKPVKRANAEANAAIPTKIARAGSNKFKKQVREFVEEYEKKHVDDLFETTPSKEGLPELPDFGSIKSPELATPSRSFDDDDSEVDDEAPGLLKKLSSRRRDDIDSYVLGINRQHVAGGGVMAGGKVRRVTSMITPVKTAKAKAMSAKKKAVMLVEEVGSHSLKGVVSPGGTTHVRIEKDGSSSEGEAEDDYHSSEEEEDFDLP